MRSELYEWRPVVGYEGLYEVNNLGEVRSLDRTDSMGRLKKGCILRPKYNRKNGYCQICLHNNTDIKYCYIHRLVAEAFVPNDDPQNKIYCNHINEVKTDNRACNLEWVTHSQNMRHNGLSERIAEKERNNKLNSKEIEQYDLDGNYIRTWPSINEVKRSLGISTGGISNCCQHKYGWHTAGGFRWEYKK